MVMTIEQIEIEINILKKTIALILEKLNNMPRESGRLYLDNDINVKVLNNKLIDVDITEGVKI